MIGKLTIDKASMNISYFLYTLVIIHSHGGRISRKEFGKLMGNFIGVPHIKAGKENRTPYNKSKLPRYFGFVDIELDDDSTSYLVLTHRGRILLDYVQDCGESKTSDQRYAIKIENRNDFIDLIFESIIFDSFGKNNCGAEQSNTDIEPPKVVFKTILDLQSASAEEICYVMFGMNRGVFKSYTDAIKTIKHNRSIGQNDYSGIMEQWDLANIVNDCKIINIFTDPNIRLLTAEKDRRTNKTYYSLNSSLNDEHKKQIESLSATYRPVSLFVYSKTNYHYLSSWVNSTVLGRVSNNEFIFRCDNIDDLFGNCESPFNPGVFEKALLKAFQYERKNIYIVCDGISEIDLVKKLGSFGNLFNRVDDYLSEKNGWSASGEESEELFKYLCSKSSKARQYLDNNKIFLPSNFHLVGVFIMSNGEKELDFDYRFKRCLVENEQNAEPLSSAHNVSESKRLTSGTNVLLYGVPGSGKSWTIQHEYCDDESRMERLVFHPDYTYSNFVGQILPDVSEGIVNYRFTPGPFTNIMKKAYEDPEHEYFLIIEEINRGNAPAIFGEVFQLLDRKNQVLSENDDGFPIGTSEYGITNTDIANEVYGDPTHKVRIPSNLSIIGTMNTSDQNVFTLDTAFQRRWSMRLIESTFTNVAKELKDHPILDSDITWEGFCEGINNTILRKNVRVTSSEDKRIGPYFIHISDLEYDPREKDMTLPEMERIKAKHHNALFAEKVIKYLWDDAFKFSRADIFRTDQYYSLEQVLTVFARESGKKRFSMFKDEIVLLFEAPFLN